MSIYDAERYPFPPEQLEEFVTCQMSMDIWHPMRKSCFMRIALLFWLLTIGVHSLALEPDSTFHRATQAATSGDFKEAIDLYRQLIDTGYFSASLYYNLGLAYLHADSLGQARLWFERAMRLDPDDPELLHNLEVLCQRLPDQFEQQPGPLFVGLWSSFVLKLGVSWWLWLALLSWWTLLTMAALWWWKRWMPPKWGLALVVVVFLTTALIACQRYRMTYSTKEEVVMAAEVPVKTAPDEYGQVKLNIHAGTKVYILDQLTGHYKVELPNGETGWVEQLALEKI